MPLAGCGAGRIEASDLQLGPILLPMRFILSSLFCIATGGCGTDFSTAPMAAAGLGGAPSTSEVVSTFGGNVPTLGSEGVAGAKDSSSASPCGPLRDDPASAAVELCVPEGDFTMGSQSANLGNGHADHTPAHQVTLSAYVIDSFEVTVGRYRTCVLAGSCGSPSTDVTRGCTYAAVVGLSDSLPVSCVTASQAEEFCIWDNGRRLPTEAEWERSARGSDERLFPWGSVFACDRAVAAANATCASVHSGIAAVGSVPAGNSPTGAHDMAGNVAEWVKDFASSYPTTKVTDPIGPATGVSRILRGGSVSSNSLDTQTFVRLTTAATTIGAFGFRCARSVAQ